MSAIESALRGGAITLLALLAILLVRDARRVVAARFAAAYAVGVAAYVVVSASAFIASIPLWLLPLQMIGAGNPVVFWLLAATLFDDEFAPKQRHYLAWATLTALGFACFYSDRPMLHSIATAASLLCNVAALWYAVSGRSEDLIEQRRQLRVAFIAAAALYSIAQITAEYFVTANSTRTAFENLNAAGLTAITLVFCFELLAVRRDGSIISLQNLKRPAAKAAPVSEHAAAESAKQNDVWLAALKRVMETDKIYREEAMSVATLADKLNIPDYRLRRLINQELGYRNFTAFLNDYRLTDVMAALADPAQAETPVLTIALSAGFQSIGPFNRAFKAKTGVTPTEYRQQELAKAQRRTAA